MARALTTASQQRVEQLAGHRPRRQSKLQYNAARPPLVASGSHDIVCEGSSEMKSKSTIKKTPTYRRRRSISKPCNSDGPTPGR
eukprot:CAMPEP_0177577780 /NCGR_PEP_ID=MMETSP0369-20130122/80814_1 /TAXON_ID=447022 ORGANISM="Scrippsiella hangoei-like, Strain SHHI-4" /NCGR_SAMPLE_ID=MMETSP0369 /ASSEMBLY_ACC=CAM_ASM_000364 /LENGTH=83 /DNA_ID=CAMNT_0019066123 /DNA_START=526 /DNA_END=778 /DNA_ORIENTATION=+